jgi:hypothetical protein
MDATGNRNAIFGDDIQFHEMLIDLGQLGWGRNRESKRKRRLPGTWRVFLLAACPLHSRLLFEGKHTIPYLTVGRKRKSGASLGS